MRENKELEAYLNMIYGDEYEMLGGTIGIVWGDDRFNQRYNIVSESGALLIEEAVKNICVLDIDERFVFVLCDYKPEDAVNEFFGDETDEQAVVIYDNGEFYTNCKALSDKYKYDSGIHFENKFTWRDKEYHFGITTIQDVLGLTFTNNVRKIQG